MESTVKSCEQYVGKPLQAGDTVVCINDRFPQNSTRAYHALPIRGNVYIVREVRTVGYDRHNSVLLEGVLNGRCIADPTLERGFKASRFILQSEFADYQNSVDHFKKIHGNMLQV